MHGYKLLTGAMLVFRAKHTEAQCSFVYWLFLCTVETSTAANGYFRNQESAELVHTSVLAGTHFETFLVLMLLAHLTYIHNVLGQISFTHSAGNKNGSFLHVKQKR